MICKCRQRGGGVKWGGHSCAFFSGVDAGSVTLAKMAEKDAHDWATSCKLVDRKKITHLRKHTHTLTVRALRGAVNLGLGNDVAQHSAPAGRLQFDDGVLVLLGLGAALGGVGFEDRARPLRPFDPEGV